MPGRPRILVAAPGGVADDIAGALQTAAGEWFVQTAADPRALAQVAVTSPWTLCVVAPGPPWPDVPAILAALREAGVPAPTLLLADAADEDEALAWLQLGVREVVPAGQLRRLAAIVQRILREPALAPMQERLAAVGMFAAGLAHELNNPLAALIFNVEHAQRRLGGGAEVDELREALACAERLRQIIRDLRIFARPEDRKPGPLDLHVVLGATLQLLGSEIRRRGSLRLRYGEIPQIHGHDAFLAHTLFCLLHQALQTLPPDQTGSLTVHTALLDDHVRIDLVVEGEKTSAARLDQGRLTICRAALASTGGHLSIEGPGLILRIALPVARARASGPLPRASALPRAVIVDDDRAVAQTIRRLLAREFQVEVLLEPREALARLTAGERFEVIVCDLMMPTLPGPEFHRRIAALDPAQAARMVFMTGGVFTRDLEDFRAAIKNPCLDKPFSAQALAAAVAQVRTA